MSVILYEDEKFLKIRSTMQQNARDWANTFGYPDNWQEYGVMENVIANFCQQLRLGNIRAWNARYDESEISKILPQHNGGGSYQNKYQLLKSLHSIHYNCVEAEDQGLNKILEDVIYHLMYELIAQHPLYKHADTW